MLHKCTIEKMHGIIKMTGMSKKSRFHFRHDSVTAASPEAASSEAAASEAGPEPLLAASLVPAMDHHVPLGLVDPAGPWRIHPRLLSGG